MRRNVKDYTSTPEIIDYPVKTRDDWEKIKERLKPDRDRVDWEGIWLGRTKGIDRGLDSILETDRADQRLGLPGFHKAREQGRFIVYDVAFGYSVIPCYIRSDQFLMLIATDPEWVRDMYEIMKKGGFEFDGAFLACDLGYRNSLLFSPHHFKEQLRPTFQRLVDYFKGEGMPVILHSDGHVKELIPYFIEDGLTCLQPLEVKAGMDLVQLKKDFGEKLAFMGGN